MYLSVLTWMRRFFGVRDICDSIAAKRISVSVGVVWEESSSELETMLRRADDLMYAEKKKYYEEHGTM